MKRLYDDIQDISLDVPNASALLDRLCTKFFENKILSETIYKELTARFLCWNSFFVHRMVLSYACWDEAAFHFLHPSGLQASLEGCFPACDIEANVVLRLQPSLFLGSTIK